MNPLPVSMSYLDLLRLTWPEIAVTVSALAALAADLLLLRQFAPRTRWRVGCLIACAGCVAAILLLQLRPQQASFYDGMLLANPLIRLVQSVLAGFAILTVLLSVGSTFTTHVGEYFAVILFATAAMMFLAGTENLLMVFIALELLSLSLYILTAFNKRSQQSAEAALKYFLFGGMSAAFFLFGISLLYGLSGSIDLPVIDLAIQAHTLTPLLAVAMVATVIGFGFKVAAVPFHLWAPDAYQGAPTPSAAFIASSSKVASFFIFAQVMLVGLAAAEGSGAPSSYTAGWAPVIVVVAALSMILGNLAAIVQTSVRRLLAYSAIGHAGYMLLGILAYGELGVPALLYYVFTYALAAIGAFGVLVALEEEGVDQIADFAGLSRRAPLLSFCMLIFLLSLAGIPPLAGFFAKFYIFSSALSGGHLGLLWLVILAIAMSAVSLYYYLRVLKQIYVRDRSATHDLVGASNDPVRAHAIVRATLGVIAALVILLGCFPNLLLSWIDSALRAMPH